MLLFQIFLRRKNKKLIIWFKLGKDRHEKSNHYLETLPASGAGGGFCYIATRTCPWLSHVHRNAHQKSICCAHGYHYHSLLSCILFWPNHLPPILITYFITRQMGLCKHNPNWVFLAATAAQEAHMSLCSSVCLYPSYVLQLLANFSNFWQLLATYGNLWQLGATSGKFWQRYNILTLYTDQLDGPLLYIWSLGQFAYLRSDL